MERPGGFQLLPSISWQPLRTHQKVPMIIFATCCVSQSRCNNNPRRCLRRFRHRGVASFEGKFAKSQNRAWNGDRWRAACRHRYRNAAPAPGSKRPRQRAGISSRCARRQDRSTASGRGSTRSSSPGIGKDSAGTAHGVGLKGAICSDDRHPSGRPVRAEHERRCGAQDLFYQHKAR